jgi:hypothetical protein
MAGPVRLVPQEGWRDRVPQPRGSGSLLSRETRGVPLRPDGTPDWPSSACRVVFGYEPTRLVPGRAEPIRQSIPEQLDLDEAI